MREDGWTIEIVDVYSYQSWPGLYHVFVENTGRKRSAEATYVMHGPGAEELATQPVPGIPARGEGGYTVHCVQVQLREEVVDRLGDTGGVTHGLECGIGKKAPKKGEQAGEAKTRRKRKFEPRRAAELRQEIRAWRKTAGENRWLEGVQILERCMEELLRKRVTGLRAGTKELAVWLEERVGTRGGEAPSAGQLLNRLRNARNGAVHRGTACARLEEDAGTVLLMVEQALAYDMEEGRTAGSIMVREVLWARPSETVGRAKDRMLQQDVTALPIDDERFGDCYWLTAGDIAEEAVEHEMKDRGRMDRKVEELEQRKMLRRVTFVDIDESVERVRELLAEEPAVLVGEKGEVKGIITEFDILYCSGTG